MPRSLRSTTFIVSIMLVVSLSSFLPQGMVLAAQATVRGDSPSSYVVVDGDTLWDIAGTFLEQPWLWPQVWQINPQIRNPDLIYPGDVIELAYENGMPVLRLSNGNGRSGSNIAPPVSGMPTVKLSPEIRRETIVSPIPSIPLDRISSYLSYNTVVSADRLASAPYVLGEREGRQLASEGDEIMTRGDWTAGVITYDIVRAGRGFKDPDTGDAIGMEAVFIGSATITSSNGREAFMEVGEIEQEVRAGDFLLPRESSKLDSRYLPAPPDFAVDAAIVSIGAGRSMGGAYDTLILNVGSDAGIESGQILSVQEPDTLVSDDVGRVTPWKKLKQVVGLDKSHQVKFPGKESATVLVYRVFESSSLALVLASKKPIHLSDRVITPL